MFFPPYHGCRYGSVMVCLLRLSSFTKVTPFQTVPLPRQLQTVWSILNSCPWPTHQKHSVCTPTPTSRKLSGYLGYLFWSACVYTSIILLLLIFQQLRVMGLKTRSASAFMSKNIEYTCSRITNKQTNKQKNTIMHIVPSLELLVMTNVIERSV